MTAWTTTIHIYTLTHQSWGNVCFARRPTKSINNTNLSIHLSMQQIAMLIFFFEGSNVNLLSQHYRLLFPVKNHKCNKLLEGLSNLDIVLLHKFQNEIGCWFRAYTCVGNILVACFPCSPPRDVINCGYDIKLSKFEIWKCR